MNKLTSLYVDHADEVYKRFDFLLPKLKTLNTLSVSFEVKVDPNIFSNIYKQCSVSLKTYEIKVKKYGDSEKFVEKTIELMKENLILRNSPLIFKLNPCLSVNEAIRINQFIEKDF